MNHRLRLAALPALTALALTVPAALPAVGVGTDVPAPPGLDDLGIVDGLRTYVDPTSDTVVQVGEGVRVLDVTVERLPDGDTLVALDVESVTLDDLAAFGLASASASEWTNQKLRSSSGGGCGSDGHSSGIWLDNAEVQMEGCFNVSYFGKGDPGNGWNPSRWYSGAATEAYADGKSMYLYDFDVRLKPRYSDMQFAGVGSRIPNSNPPGDCSQLPLTLSFNATKRVGVGMSFATCDTLTVAHPGNAIELDWSAPWWQGATKARRYLGASAIHQRSSYGYGYYATYTARMRDNT